MYALYINSNLMKSTGLWKWSEKAAVLLQFCFQGRTSANMMTGTLWHRPLSVGTLLHRLLLYIILNNSSPRWWKSCQKVRMKSDAYMQEFWRWKLLSNQCITKCKQCHLTSFWVCSWNLYCLIKNQTILTPPLHHSQQQQPTMVKNSSK